MSGYVNKVILIGNLGKDPESYTMSSGKKMLSFSLATSESWLDRNTNERTTKTEWHNVVIFNEQLISSVGSYLKKGTKIYVEGNLRTRKWSDSNNNDRYTTEVVLQGYGAVLRLLDSKRNAGDASDAGSAQGGRSGYENSGGEKSAPRSEGVDLGEDLADDEIPF